jgi:hypothetical protein
MTNRLPSLKSECRFTQVSHVILKGVITRVGFDVEFSTDYNAAVSPSSRTPFPIVGNGRLVALRTPVKRRFTHG